MHFALSLLWPTTNAASFKRGNYNHIPSFYDILGKLDTTLPTASFLSPAEWSYEEEAKIYFEMSEPEPGRALWIWLRGYFNAPSQEFPNISPSKELLDRSIAVGDLSLLKFLIDYVQGSRMEFVLLQLKWHPYEYIKQYRLDHASNVDDKLREAVKRLPEKDLTAELCGLLSVFLSDYPKNHHRIPKQISLAYFHSTAYNYVLLRAQLLLDSKRDIVMVGKSIKLHVMARELSKEFPVYPRNPNYFISKVIDQGDHQFNPVVLNAAWKDLGLSSKQNAKHFIRYVHDRWPQWIAMRIEKGELQLVADYPEILLPYLEGQKLPPLNLIFPSPELKWSPERISLLVTAIQVQGYDDKDYSASQLLIMGMITQPTVKVNLDLIYVCLGDRFSDFMSAYFLWFVKKYGLNSGISDIWDLSDIVMALLPQIHSQTKE